MVYHVGQGTFRVSRCLEYRDLMITEIQDISLFYDLVYHKIFIPVVRGFCKSGPLRCRVRELTHRLFC